MILADTLLQKLASWSPPGEGRHTLAFLEPVTGTAVQLAVDRLEALSCQLWEVRVTRGPAAVADDPLADWAQRVADRVTGLLEPLKVIEIDPECGQALLRSDEPARKDDDRFYYEVLLQRTGNALVRRYRGSLQASKRQQVAFALTREALAKLVADLAASQ